MKKKSIKGAVGCRRIAARKEVVRDASPSQHTAARQDGDPGADVVVDEMRRAVEPHVPGPDNTVRVDKQQVLRNAVLHDAQDVLPKGLRALAHQEVALLHDEFLCASAVQLQADRWFVLGGGHGAAKRKRAIQLAAEWQPRVRSQSHGSMV